MGLWAWRAFADEGRTPARTVSLFFAAQEAGDCELVLDLLTEASWSQDGARSRREFLDECRAALVGYQPVVDEVSIAPQDDDGHARRDGDCNRLADLVTLEAGRWPGPTIATPTSSSARGGHRVVDQTLVSMLERSSPVLRFAVGDGSGEREGRLTAVAEAPFYALQSGAPAGATETVALTADGLAWRISSRPMPRPGPRRRHQHRRARLTSRTRWSAIAREAATAGTAPP
jgi:hypothetical protein